MLSRLPQTVRYKRMQARINGHRFGTVETVGSLQKQIYTWLDPVHSGKVEMFGI